jgi:hypothetical protein
MKVSFFIALKDGMIKFKGELPCVLPRETQISGLPGVGEEDYFFLEETDEEGYTIEEQTFFFDYGTKTFECSGETCELHNKASLNSEAAQRYLRCGWVIVNDHRKQFGVQTTECKGNVV